MNALRVIQRRIGDGGQCFGDQITLFIAESKTRPRLIGQATARGIQFGEWCRGDDGLLQIIVTVRAPELAEMLTSALGERCIHVQRFKGLGWLFGNGEHRCGDRTTSKLRRFHLETQLRLPAGMKIHQFDLMRPGLQLHGGLEGLHAAPITRSFLHQHLAIHFERAAIHGEEKRMRATLRHLQPTFVAHRRVLLHAPEARQRKVGHLTAALRFDLFTVQAFPHLTAIQRVAQRAGHAGLLQQKVSDLLRVASLQPHVRHPARRPAGVRRAQKLHKALLAVFSFQRPQWHRIRYWQLLRIFRARCVTGRAAA